MFKAAPSMALSETGGTIRCRTAGSRYLEDDAGTCIRISEQVLAASLFLGYILLALIVWGIFYGY
ncbi:hypothetical protein DESME_02295 [Desulfitobacterium metallireducens DSM 15288]|uniref:Uncharacterized protein n=2 Tax=Desulfitobacterium TaxID=36853 RepID=W0EFX4_9FIRM|nr:hypothetical protein DESME_02295 [Desulfitobacterium metallireducens DSM 15288]